MSLSARSYRRWKMSKGLCAPEKWLRVLALESLKTVNVIVVALLSRVLRLDDYHVRLHNR